LSFFTKPTIIWQRTSACFHFLRLQKITIMINGVSIKLS
jgi:hypothetical protein